MSERGRNNETVGFARVWMCVLTAIGPHLDVGA